MTRVDLRDIVRSADRAAVMSLRRGPGQDQYLDSMESIFAAVEDEQRAMPHPWAVHDAGSGALVGFAMISDNIPQPIDEDLVGPYFLWKLLIDESFQGRGYGAATLDAVVNYLRTRPAPTCSTPAARTARARREGSTFGTAFATPAASCGARTSSSSTSRRKHAAPRGRPSPRQSRVAALTRDVDERRITSSGLNSTAACACGSFWSADSISANSSSAARRPRA